MSAILYMSFKHANAHNINAHSARLGTREKGMKSNFSPRCGEAGIIGQGLSAPTEQPGIHDGSVPYPRAPGHQLPQRRKDPTV